MDVPGVTRVWLQTARSGFGTPRKPSLERAARSSSCRVSPMSQEHRRATARRIAPAAQRCRAPPSRLSWHGSREQCSGGRRPWIAKTTGQLTASRTSATTPSETSRQRPPQRERRRSPSRTKPRAISRTPISVPTPWSLRHRLTTPVRLDTRRDKIRRSERSPAATSVHRINMVFLWRRSRDRAAVRRLVIRPQAVEVLALSESRLSRRN